MTKYTMLKSIQRVYRALNADEPNSDLCRHLDRLTQDMVDRKLITAAARQEMYDTM